MSPCPTGGTCPLPPPCDPNPPRGQGTGVKGCGSWTQRPQEAGHSRTSQEDTLSTGSAAAATAGNAREPRRTPGISGLGHPAWQHNTVHPRPLLASRLAGGQCLKGDRWVFPLTSNLQLQLGGVWPREVVTKRSHVHSGLRPLQHQDRSLPLYTPSPTRSRPPTGGQRPRAMPQRGEPSQPGSRAAPKETA